ncbi:MAG: DEAD/DEAH box helicase family protein, partial [bacterium]
YNDYIPLYDVSINKNYIPVARFIEQKYLISNDKRNDFLGTLMSAYEDNFKLNEIYLSQGQKELNIFSEKQNNYIMVAPTSYGKSEIIISKIEKCLSRKTCIIVPSKALLSQTRRRLLENKVIRDGLKKIITHPDMYKPSDNSFVAVLTQERLLRLLQKNNNLFFDIVFVDEAHNLIKKDDRSTLLFQNLLILKKRNPSTIINYFTPFLASPEKLSILSKNTIIESKKINEYIKVERYYIYDLLNRRLKLYDQFLNKFFDVEQEDTVSEIDFINHNKSNKNVVYLNRPQDVEKFSLSIVNNIDEDEELTRAKKALSDFLHKDYNLIDAISNGVVYHHGGMPEIVRMYVENLFSKNNKLSLIITNSTLLEGVNIPAEKIFLLTPSIGNKNFNPSQFKNIVGRVCRFSEVFNSASGNLNLLEPEVFLIKGRFTQSNANLERFLEKTVKENIEITDKIENVLIKNNNVEQLNEEESGLITKQLEYLENIEPGTSTSDATRYVDSDIAKLCFKNNVHDFDIYLNEDTLVKSHEESKNMTEVSNAGDLIELVVRIFLNNITSNVENNNFKRLENVQAQKFYAMFLGWRASGASYKKMVGSFVSYWNKLDNKIIYVGQKWGEIKREEADRKLLYVDLSKKTQSQIINLAILRIKEEQDFIEFELMKYIEILNDLGYLNKEFYEMIKFGSSNLVVIRLLKEGFSIELAKCIIKEIYKDYISLDEDVVAVKNEIIDEMKKEKENELLIFEIKYHTNKN